MHKVTYQERRSGIERRQHKRRGFVRWLKTCWKLSSYRRHWIRRAPYIRSDTYNEYLPDRL